MSTKPIAVLVDFNNLLYRMYHTQPPRINNGNRMESLQAAANSVFGYFDDKNGVGAKADVVVIVADHDGKTFRHDLSPLYKAERKGMPEDLKSQEVPAFDLLKAAGIPAICKEGYEADDALGMAAHFYKEKGYKVVISTTDKDMHQLVEDDILIHNAVSKKLMNASEVVKKFHVGPDKIAELLAIMGDKEDGIVGIPDVGLKTAANWLNKYGSIAGIENNKDSVSGRGAKSLRESNTDLSLNLELSTIRSNPNALTKEEIEMLESPKQDRSAYEQIEYDYQLRLKPNKSFSFESKESLDSMKNLESNVEATEPDDEAQQFSLF